MSVQEGKAPVNLSTQVFPKKAKLLKYEGEFPDQQPKKS